MRHTGFVTGVLCTILSRSVHASNLPTGVGPEFVKFYDHAKDTFQCISHPSIVLKSSQINDNTCDCPDGSDEPGTSACAYIDQLSPEQPLKASTSGTTNASNSLPGFWCANEGHVGAYVPFMYVNDGVCDYNLCCDGSEEWAQVGGIKCENRCDSIGKEFRRTVQERDAARERATKKRLALVKEAQELRKKVKANIVTTQQEIKQLKVKKDELEQKLKEVEKAESSRVVKTEGQGGKLGILIGLAKGRVGELREALDKVLTQRNELQEKVDKLEGILRKFKEEYNPNFNDEGVKSAVHAWEDYAAALPTEDKTAEAESDDTYIEDLRKEDGEESGINWNEFKEESSDADILYDLKAYLPPFLHEFVNEKLKSLRTWLIDNGLMADNSIGSDGESRQLTAAKHAFRDANDDLGDKETELGKLERDLEKNYGTDDIFRALQDKCISRDSGEYEYEHCWLDKTAQKSKKGHGNTNMGNFDRIDVEMADDEERTDGKSLGKGPRLVFRYINGQGCWNGPARRTDVWLGCAEKDEVWRVSESEKCVYKMEVGSPAACEEVVIKSDAPAPADGKDEL